MSKILVVDHERCTGGRICEIVCSVKNEHQSDPSRARIQVIKWEMEGYNLPMVCQHCEVPLCASVCPVNAIFRDNSRGVVVTDDNLCIGCRACLSICPLGGISFDGKGKKILRCNHCQGDPTCVKFCDTKALQYIDEEQLASVQKRSKAIKLYHALKRDS